MRKVLRDGRAREDVHDLLGVRVIVSPEPGSPADGDDAEASRNQMAACYRAREIAHETFDVVPGRAKDYLARPKANGYRSLHSTLELPAEWGGDDEDEDEDEDADASDASEDASDASGRFGRFVASDASSSDPSASSSSGASSRRSPGGVRARARRRVELQVRTSEMHAAAEMAPPRTARTRAGSRRTPARRRRWPSWRPPPTRRRSGSELHRDGRRVGGGASDADRVFRMFDLDGDGRVTREELRAVIGDVWRGGAGGGAALEDDGGAAADLLAAIDADEDGTVSPEEFARFRTSLKVLGSLPGADAAAKRTIDVAAAGGGKKEAEGEEEEEEQGDHGSASSGDHASASSGDHGSSGSSGSSGAGVGSSATSAPDASYVVTVPISKRVGPLSTSAPPSSERGAAETSSSARTSADASAASLAAPPPARVGGGGSGAQSRSPGNHHPVASARATAPLDDEKDALRRRRRSGRVQGAA